MPSACCFSWRIQLREDSFEGERPKCPRGCPQRLHRHGCYRRYLQPTGQVSWKIARYLCAQCGHTVSVIPVAALPYRPLEVKRLQAYLDEKAEVGSGPDPPPNAAEAGCLKRAWSRFTSRLGTLQQAFGQRLPANLPTPAQLWLELRRLMSSLNDILLWLARTRNLSLLGDYRCLRPALAD